MVFGISVTNVPIKVQAEMTAPMPPQVRLQVWSGRSVSLGSVGEARSGCLRAASGAQQRLAVQHWRSQSRAYEPSRRRVNANPAHGSVG